MGAMCVIKWFQASSIHRTHEDRSWYVVKKSPESNKIGRYDSKGDETARNVGNNYSDDFRNNSGNKNRDTNLKILLNWPCLWKNCFEWSIFLCSLYATCLELRYHNHCTYLYLHHACFFYFICSFTSHLRYIILFTNATEVTGISKRSFLTTPKSSSVSAT